MLFLFTDVLLEIKHSVENKRAPRWLANGETVGRINGKCTFLPELTREGGVSHLRTCQNGRSGHAHCSDRAFLTLTMSWLFKEVDRWDQKPSFMDTGGKIWRRKFERR